MGMFPSSDQRMNSCVGFSELGFGVRPRSRCIEIDQRHAAAARAGDMRAHSVSHIHMGMSPSSDQIMNIYIWVVAI
eukprot:7714984-Pyramimonas_sp.AAC.1